MSGRTLVARPGPETSLLHLPTILSQFREFLLRHIITQNPCRQSGDQRLAIGRALFPAARSSRPLAKATARGLLAPPSHPEMNGHPSGPCDRLVAAAAEGPHAQKPHSGPSRRPPLGMEGEGEGEAVASARRASARKGGDEPGRRRATEGRDGAAHAEPNPQPRRPSHGGEGDGGGGMAAASPKSQPPPLHGREGEEGARAEPHPRPRPPAIPASWRGGGGSSPASAPREGAGPGCRRATPAGGCSQRRPRAPPRAPPLGPAAEVAPGFSRTRPPGNEPVAAVSPAAACSRMRPLLFGLAALAASSAAKRLGQSLAAPLPCRVASPLPRMRVRKSPLFLQPVSSLTRSRMLLGPRRGRHQFDGFGKERETGDTGKNKSKMVCW